ncbi:hypothetical protein GCM10027168_37840 [Streptomyces capparidis]
MRSTMWSLGVMVVLVVGIGLLMTFTVGEDEFDDSPILSFGLPGVLLGQLCVVTLGVLVVTSEYSTGMIRTTLTACPKRGRMLTAKALVFTTVALVLSTASAGLVALVNYAQFDGRDATPDYVVADELGRPDFVAHAAEATTGEIVRATLGVGLYMALLGLLSLAVGVLLRHTAGAVTVMLGVILLPLLISLFIPAEDVREKIQEYSSINIVAQLYEIPMVGDANGWGLLGGLAGVTLVVLGGAYAALNARDV